MKEKVVFETNVPIELCLADAEGKEVEGRLGDEIMYSLSDGRVMFVPVSVRDELSRVGVKPGEPFTLCRREINGHGEDFVEWVANRKNANGVSKAVENIQRKLEAAGLVLSTCNRLTNNSGYQLSFASDEVVNVFNTGRISIQGKNEARVRGILGLGTSISGEITKNPGLSAASNTSEKSSGSNGEPASKANGHAKLSYIMQMALQGALDATAAVEQYAEKSGIVDRNGDPFRFSNADIRAIGLSMFIEARKRA